MEAVDGRAWSAVAGQIMLGVAHETNNRLLALMGLRELAEEGLDAELLRLFDDELARLDGSNRLLRRLAEAPSGPAVLEAGGLVETVKELHALNSGLRAVATDWSVAPELPAVHVDGVLATRALLLALDAAGRVAAEAGIALGVSVGDGGGAVRIDVTPAPADGERLRALEAAGASQEVAGGLLRVRFATA